MRNFMIQNKLSKFADAIVEEGWVLEDLAVMSSTELQGVANDIKMKKGHATRFKSAVAKLSSPPKCEDLLIRKSLHKRPVFCLHSPPHHITPHHNTLTRSRHITYRTTPHSCIHSHPRFIPIPSAASFLSVEPTFPSPQRCQNCQQGFPRNCQEVRRILPQDRQL